MGRLASWLLESQRLDDDPLAILEQQPEQPEMNVDASMAEADAILAGVLELDQPQQQPEQAEMDVDASFGEADAILAVALERDLAAEAVQAQDVPVKCHCAKPGAFMVDTRNCGKASRPGHAYTVCPSHV